MNTFHAFYPGIVVYFLFGSFFLILFIIFLYRILTGKYNKKVSILLVASSALFPLVMSGIFLFLGIELLAIKIIVTPTKLESYKLNSYESVDLTINRIVEHNTHWGKTDPSGLYFGSTHLYFDFENNDGVVKRIDIRGIEIPIRLEMLLIDQLKLMK